MLLAYRSPAASAAAPPADRPRLAELSTFLERGAVLVVFACGLLLSIAQSSVLAYLALFAKETFAASPGAPSATAPSVAGAGPASP